MNRLKDKVAVITGGSAGIGFAIASEFASEGAKVIITGRNQNTIDEAIRELGSNAFGFRADSSNLSDTALLVQEVRSRFSGIDILVVNAGISPMEPVGQITEQGFDDIMDINFKGAVFTTERLIPLLSEGASVIFISSVSSFAVAGGTAIYAASKAALNAYSRTAALELASRKIRVNAINPALTQTRLVESSVGDIQDFLKAKMPFKRFAQPVEVARLAVFLASDDASFISGGEYNIDGAAAVNEPFRA